MAHTNKFLREQDGSLTLKAGKDGKLIPVLNDPNNLGQPLAGWDEKKYKLLPGGTDQFELDPQGDPVEEVQAPEPKPATPPAPPITPDPPVTSSPATSKKKFNWKLWGPIFAGILVLVILALFVWPAWLIPSDPTIPPTDTTQIVTPPVNNIPCDQSFVWDTLSPARQIDLKTWAAVTPNPLDLTNAKVMLKTEITNYEGKGTIMVWIQVEGLDKWPVDYVAKPENIKL